MNTYLNCDYRCDDSLLDFIYNKSILANLLLYETFDYVVIVVDFNKDRNRGQFHEKLDMLIREFTLYPVDILNLPVDSCTYVSANVTATTSWLDHIFC